MTERERELLVAVKVLLRVVKSISGATVLEPHVHAGDGNCDCYYPNYNPKTRQLRSFTEEIGYAEQLIAEGS